MKKMKSFFGSGKKNEMLVDLPLIGSEESLKNFDISKRNLYITPYGITINV